MADRDDPPPSYDPRSWTGDAESRSEPESGTSFDPRTWADAGGTEATPAARAAPKPGIAGSAILAGAVALILFSLGGAAAYVARDQHKASLEATDATPRPEIVVEPD